MTETVGIDLQLNSQQYSQQAGLAQAQSTALAQSLAGLAASVALVGRGWNNAAPSRTHLAAFGSFAAMAAQSERNLSGLNATQAVTGQRADQLGRGIRSLARDFPIGNAAAQQTVTTFTQLGLAMKGQEQRVLSLSKTMVQLQGANGGFAPQYAQSMAQLERTFGDQGLDPKRVADTADALTTVSKLGGAPAQSVLDFANAIGPMAQASGIGKTATLGIATAFTRIGQDGTSAGTAVNKMLSDMSRAVRDGGPQMHTYANIVGTTADNFERLFKSNPAEALTQVTEAIGKSGTAGPRILENLGLDGVRTQRALQALSASGGLRQQIDTAVGAYGSGSTQRAAQASFQGYLDNMQRAGTAAGQLGVALGTPLLKPLNELAGIATHVAGGLAHLADTTIGRGTLSTIAYGGLAFMAARRIAGAGFGAAAIRQGITSGPVGSAIAGYRIARGDQVVRNAQGNITQIGRNGVFGFGRTAGDMGRAYEQGTLGNGFMGGTRSRLFGFGMGAGEAAATRAYNRDFAQATRYNDIRDRYGANSRVTRRMEQSMAGGGGIRDRFSRTVGTFATAYGRVMQGGVDASYASPLDREQATRSRLSFMGGNVGQFGRDLGTATKNLFTGREGLSGTVDKVKTSFNQMNANLAESGRRFPGFLAGIRAVGMAGGAGIGSAIGAAGSVGRGLGAGLLRMLNTSGLGLTAGIMGVGYLMNYGSQRNAARKAEVERENNASPTDQIDRYNDAIGRATSQTSSFADAMTTTTRLVNTSAKTMSAALTVRPEDTQAAQAQPKQTMAFARESTPASLAAQIRQMSPAGMDPTQMNAIKLDLIRQFDPATVNKTLAILQREGLSSTAGAGGTADLTTLAGKAAGINVDIGMGRDSNKVSSSDYYASWLDKPIGGYTLKKSAQDINDTISGSLTQRYLSQSDLTGGSYAQQTRLRDINAIMMKAAKSGNEAEVNSLGDQIARQQLGITKIPRITSEQITRAGGYIQALAAADPNGFGKQFAAMQREQGITLSGNGVPMMSQRSPLAQSMQPYSLLRDVFDNTLRAPRETDTRADRGVTATRRGEMVSARDAMAEALAKPDNLQLAAKAVQSFVDATTKAGGSLGDLAAQAQKAAIANGDQTSPAYQQLLATQAEAQFRQQAMTPFRSSGQNLGTAMVDTSKIIAAGPGSTAETKQNYDQARSSFADLQAQMADMVKQRLEAERQYQIQSRRAQEDFDKQTARANEDFQNQQLFAAQDYFKQRAYAQQDYEKSVARSTRDFQKSEERAEEDYQLQLTRTLEDYNTQRSREVRDFNISMQRGQDDYFTQRSRSIRDFNIQLARQIEDQTKTLYDPYKRIQTQAVWDGKQLLANMADQNKALQQQQSQLGQARQMGLTDATIQQLGLNDPANQQQLAKLIDDFMSDPQLVQQLNASTNTRASIGKLLLTDPSNKDIQRAKDDFNRSLSDMQADYSKQVTRARADMAKQMADQEADFGKSLSRMAQDYEKNMARNQQDFAISMSDAAQDFAISMQRQDDAYATSVQRSLLLFNIQMQRMRDDYATQMKRMREDTTESEKQLTISLTDMWDKANALIKGKNVETDTLMRDGLKDTINILKKGDIQKQLGAAYKNLFPFDLSKVFGSGGPDDAHPVLGGGQYYSGGHGGPYAPYANAGAQKQMFNHVGGAGHNAFGEMVPGARVSQGFGSDGASADPYTGGGWPVASPVISQQFGHDGHPGIDLAVGRGTPIVAPLDGMVVYAGWNDGYGNCVIMDNGGGRSTLYGHQQAINVRVGQMLKHGDLIGWVDSTGNSTGDHLHFETRMNGIVQDPAVDLPAWQATDGLGSFDPGAVARSYGVATDVRLAKLKMSDYAGTHDGPWGAYLQVGRALKDAAKKYSGELDHSLNDQSGNTQPGAALSKYRPIAVQVAQALGVPGLVDRIMMQMQTEDGAGVPDAVNKWDSNWAKGVPSVGLMQVIGPTYQSYKPADDKGPYLYGASVDPYSNIYAGVNYAIHRYAGDPNFGLGYGHGYRNGGLAMNGPVSGTIGEGGPEAIIPLNQGGVQVLSRAFRAAVHPEELRSMAHSSSTDRVSYVSQIHSEDHSTHLAVEELKVVSDDPNDMMRKIDARARTDALTKSGPTR